MKPASRIVRAAVVLIGFIAPVMAGPMEPALTLSMSDAIKQAIETHLTIRLARASTQEARGRTIQAAASLLPQVTGSVSQTRTFKTNLAAQGFSTSPALPNLLIGPYNTFDARIELVQKILDVSSIWNTKAASANAQAAKLAEDLAAEQVASGAALAYIEGLRALRDVQDAQSNLSLAQKLSDLAHHQHDAGLTNGVDVARAETRVAQDRQRLIQAQLAAIQAEIRLKRVVGIPLGTALVLSEPEKKPSDVIPSELPLITQAQSDRVELCITRELVQAETYSLSAARAGHLPVVTAGANYGFSGNTPDSTARTGQIGGQLDLPIFSGGSTHGQVVEAQGRQAAAQSQDSDTRIQVEEDVRLALQTLSAEVDEVEASETQVKLAERELQLAQDRYTAGVGDNIQVVTAQTSLENALQSRADAQARHADAQANLAMAVGHMRTFSL